MKDKCRKPPVNWKEPSGNRVMDEVDQMRFLWTWLCYCQKLITWNCLPTQKTSSNTDLAVYLFSFSAVHMILTKLNGKKFRVTDRSCNRPWVTLFSAIQKLSIFEVVRNLFTYEDPFVLRTFVMVILTKPLESEKKLKSISNKDRLIVRRKLRSRKFSVSVITSVLNAGWNSTWHNSNGIQETKFHWFFYFGKKNKLQFTIKHDDNENTTRNCFSWQ